MRVRDDGMLAMRIVAEPWGLLLGDRAGGAVAQLGEHLLCKQGVSGSIPLSSTKSIGVETGGGRSESSASAERVANRLAPLRSAFGA